MYGIGFYYLFPFTNIHNSVLILFYLYYYHYFDIHISFHGYPVFIMML